MLKSLWLRLSTEMDITGELKVLLPFNDLLIRLVWVFRAEGRVSYKERKR